MEEKVDFKYPEKEKLKSQKIIDSLFSGGKSVSKYPLRLVYTAIPNSDEKLKLGVSVSKKHFKHAIDRNYFKRVLRECYRLNKHLIHDNLDKPHAIMIFYQTKERLTYKDINEKTIQLFEKWIVAKKDEIKIE